VGGTAVRGQVYPPVREQHTPSTRFSGAGTVSAHTLVIAGASVVEITAADGTSGQWTPFSWPLRCGAVGDVWRPVQRSPTIQVWVVSGQLDVRIVHKKPVRILRHCSPSFARWSIAQILAGAEEEQVGEGSAAEGFRLQPLRTEAITHDVAPDLLSRCSVLQARSC